MIALEPTYLPSPGPGAPAPAAPPATAASAAPVAAEAAPAMAPDALAARPATGPAGADYGALPWDPAALEAQVEDPDARIRQLDAGTCAAAAAQKALAMVDPGRYRAIAGDLLRGGAAEIGQGERLALSPANRDWIMAQGLAGPALADAVVQAALMDWADGATAYDLGADVARADGAARGLSFAQARALNAALLGAPTLDRADAMERAYQGVVPFADAARRALAEGATEQAFAVGELRRRLEAARAEGAPGAFMPIFVDEAGGQHMVFVREIGADGVVAFVDAHGEPQRVDGGEFLESLTWSSLRPDDGGIEAASGVPAAWFTTGARSGRKPA